jgi:hypothetical protein
MTYGRKRRDMFESLCRLEGWKVGRLEACQMWVKTETVMYLKNKK